MKAVPEIIPDWLSSDSFGGEHLGPDACRPGATNSRRVAALEQHELVEKVAQAGQQQCCSTAGQTKSGKVSQRTGRESDKDMSGLFHRINACSYGRRRFSHHTEPDRRPLKLIIYAFLNCRFHMSQLFKSDSLRKSSWTHFNPVVNFEEM